MYDQRVYKPCKTHDRNLLFGPLAFLPSNHVYERARRDVQCQFLVPLYSKDSNRGFGAVILELCLQ